MRKYRRQVLALLGILVIALVASRAFIGSTYRASFQWEPASPSDPLPRLRVEPEERARVENLALEDGRLVFDVVPLQPGSVTVISITLPSGRPLFIYLSMKLANFG